MKCLECNVDFSGQKQSGKKLAIHLRSVHNLTVDEYVIKHFYDDIKPECPVCGETPRRVGFKFRTYCKVHSSEASIAGGRKGGRAPAWNKGKTKKTDARVGALAEKMTGANNPFFGKRHTEESLVLMRKQRRISCDEFEQRSGALLKRGVVVLTSYNDYQTRQNQYLDIKCSVCNHVDKKTLQALERGSLCSRCHPITTSQAELAIADFVCSLVSEHSVKRNDRHLIGPKEIDILVQEQSVGIEYDGLYWHSEASKAPSPRAPLGKTLSCADNDIRLIRIYEDAWRDRQSVCKSIIRHSLGKSDKIYARSCAPPAQISTKESAIHLDSWHIYGSTPARIAFGLRHMDELVSIITLRVPRQKKYRDQNMIEIARFASRLNTAVVGGFQRLLKIAIEWAKNEGFDGIVTYADLDLSAGSVYAKAGFEHAGDTGPSYWYSDGTTRLDRFKFRAARGKSERQIAFDNCVHRIYGAGSRIYTLRF